MAQSKYRLVTRSDFDGLVCAVLLNELDMIDDILFVHPKDMQDGKVNITDRDIVTNLPYVIGAHLIFDHHYSETIRNTGERVNHIIDADAPSAARVVYEHFGGKARFSTISDDMMIAVDKADSAQYTQDEILHPTGWVLLNYLMDARTGLGRFREFRISNYALMMDLIRYCRDHTIDEILDLPDVKERSQLYFDHEPKARDQIICCSTVHNNLVVLDLRNEETIYATNRFLIYAMYPSCNVSIHVMWGRDKQNTVFATGASIVNRSPHINIGELMLAYGGGGHANAGTCQVDNHNADSTLREVAMKITAFK
ncbi:exopolyphosphatase [Chitinivorax sp. B]|uniref:exopolyphosphatase n=1 Tax=Chitinivorax sp. B TaxID=2502235 RepID=UPI0010F9CAA6|nr:exopolyphosphatase [Chitinivorax sp. B]